MTLSTYGMCLLGNGLPAFWRFLVGIVSSVNGWKKLLQYRTYWSQYICPSETFYRPPDMTEEMPYVSLIRRSEFWNKKLPPALDWFLTESILLYYLKTLMLITVHHSAVFSRLQSVYVHIVLFDSPTAFEPWSGWLSQMVVVGYVISRAIWVRGFERK